MWARSSPESLEERTPRKIRMRRKTVSLKPCFEDDDTRPPTNSTHSMNFEMLGKPTLIASNPLSFTSVIRFHNIVANAQDDSCIYVVDVGHKPRSQEHNERTSGVCLPVCRGRSKRNNFFVQHFLSLIMDMSTNTQ